MNDEEGLLMDLADFFESISTLPNYAIRLIFWYLSDRDRFAARFTNRRFRLMAESFKLPWGVKIEETLVEDQMTRDKYYAYIARNPGFMIPILQINKLRRCLPNVENPDIIQELRIYGLITDADLGGGSLLLFLELTRPTIRTLVFSSFPFQNDDIIIPAPAQAPNGFPQLQRLEFGFDEVKSSNLSIRSNLTQLFLHPMNSLSELTFKYRCDWKEMEPTFRLFIAFLVRCQRTLKYLDTCIIPLIHNGRCPILDVQDIQLPTELRLKVFKLRLPMQYILVWAPIIQQQSQLTELVVNFFHENSPFLPRLRYGVSYHLIETAVTLSGQNLRRLFVDRILTTNTHTAPWRWQNNNFNCQHLVNAINLRELVLNRSDFSGNDDFHGPHSEITIQNLDSVPVANLTTLEIRNFVCFAEDLEYLIKRAPLLHTVKLVGVRGNEIPFLNLTGVDCNVIYAFMSKQTKKRFFATEINYDRPSDKRESLRNDYPSIRNLDSTFTFAEE